MVRGACWDMGLSFSGKNTASSTFLVSGPLSRRMPMALGDSAVAMAAMVSVMGTTSLMRIVLQIAVYHNLR